MKKIFKYILDITDRQVINIPLPANILSVSEQRDNVVLYSIVEEGMPVIPVEILIVGTGNPILFNIDDYKFVGTVNTMSGKLMWHVFYRFLGSVEVRIAEDKKDMVVV